MRISSKVALVTLATAMSGWFGAEAREVQAQAAKVPALVADSERNYEEIRLLRQQTTELLILVHETLGDIKRVAELRIELAKLKSEQRARANTKEVQ